MSYTTGHNSHLEYNKFYWQISTYNYQNISHLYIFAFIHCIDFVSPELSRRNIMCIDFYSTWFDTAQFACKYQLRN